jgi:dCMP deaminase
MLEERHQQNRSSSKGDVMRPTFHAINMRLAVEISRRSTCARLHVGCVITSEDFRQGLSSGYNGNAAGLPNECDSDVPGACGCLHAEENAVIGCTAPRELPKTVFCTDTPCKMCAKRFIQLGGVRRVFFMRDYRLTEGRKILESVGIAVEQLHLEELRELTTLRDDLTATQARCTELLLENRRLRGVPTEVSPIDSYQLRTGELGLLKTE